MKKQLEGLSFKPAWITHLGCVLGCVEYLGLHVSQAWIYGGTGHAFVINISEDACPSGPTAWKTFILTQLAPNLGYRETVHSALKTQPDFAEKQEQAFAAIRESIDNGLPCYGWELHIPEFYVINGYDEGTAWRFGHGYNAACWAECREQAVAFLQEAKERLTGEADSLFHEALEHYTVVRDKLKAVSELHPFRHGDEGNVQSPEAAGLVSEASDAEEKGLAVLEQLVEAI